MSAPLQGRSPRPALGALFSAALGAWLAAFCAEGLSWRVICAQDDLPIAPCTAGALAIACLLVFAFKRRERLPRSLRGAFRAASMGAIAFGAVFICGLFFWASWAADVDTLAQLVSKPDSLVLDLVGDPAQRDYGIVSSARVSGQAHDETVRLLWPDDATCLQAGHRVVVTGSAVSPKADDAGRWSHQNGYVGMIDAKSVRDAGVSPDLQGAIAGFRDASFERVAGMGGDAAGLLAGILLGNKTLYTQTELERAFQTTGLAHLMAVSGTHLAVVSIMLSFLLGKTPLRRKTRSMLILTALVFYVALTAFSLSALRSCVMCGVALFAGMAQRRKHVISALSLCVLVFLGLSPPIAFSLGFQLSVLAVFGLVVFEPLLEAWTLCLVPGRFEQVASVIATTLSATLMTLPVTVSQFAQLPLISPLANLVAAPFVTATLAIGIPALVLCALVPPVGGVALSAAGALASCCAALVRVLSDIPGACLPLAGTANVLGVVFGLLGFALWAFWPLPRLPDAITTPRQAMLRRMTSSVCACGLLCMPLAIAYTAGFGRMGQAFKAGDARVVMLDVGQGDSMLIESGDAHVLVDTGQEGDVLIRALAQQGVTHLDAVVITHKDADHAGALRKLTGVVAVEHVYVHADLLDEDFERSVLESARWVTGGHTAEGLRPGARLQAGEFSLDVLGPAQGGKSENDDSLVTLLEYDASNDGSVEARGLLTGDAESAATERIAEQVGHVDFLKVPHHGSKDGLSDTELACLSPGVALISVGEGNTYGHPNASTLSQLRSFGTQIFRTDRQGTLSLAFSQSGFTVTPERAAYEIR